MSIRKYKKQIEVDGKIAKKLQDRNKSDSRAKIYQLLVGYVLKKKAIYQQLKTDGKSKAVQYLSKQAGIMYQFLWKFQILRLLIIVMTV